MTLVSLADKNWSMLEPSNFWKELLNVLFRSTNNSIESTFKLLMELSVQFPERYRISFEKVVSTRWKTSNHVTSNQVSTTILRDVNYSLDTQKVLQTTGVLVPNAGLVILNGFFKMLFERLKLLEGEVFVDKRRQMEAVHFLQHVAVGHGHSEEADLVLNKILVGIPLEEPITSGIDIQNSEVEIIEGMLEAAIGHWPAIGKSSILGFRGNWFVRNGLLYEKEDYWNLIIEKRGYDILLNQTPFTFSIIKFPWMSKPLKVEWAY